MNNNSILKITKRITRGFIFISILLSLSINSQGIDASLSQEFHTKGTEALLQDIQTFPGTSDYYSPVFQDSGPALSRNQRVTIGDPITATTPPSPIIDQGGSLHDVYTLTHSTSQTIISANSIACSADGGVTTTDNGYLRKFALGDFGIFTDFLVSEVSFGVEALYGPGPTIHVNLYVLAGELLYENMTLIGSAGAALEEQNLTIVTVPISANVPAGSTLVVEVDWPDTTEVSAFFIGSNNLGQTDPSYLRSASCGLPEPTDISDIGYPGMHIVMNVTGSTPTTPPDWYKPMSSCIPAEEAPFAFVNLPWSFVEGVTSPSSTIHADLRRSASIIASTDGDTDDQGWFSMDFQISGNHVEIQPGDQVIVSGGGLGTTISIPYFSGTIDTTQDSVAGQISGVAIPALGDVCVRMPSDLSFVTEKTWFDNDGRFSVDFSGEFDIGVDHLAQVVYEDPNGSYVVQMLYPEGLNPRALINESRVEGVTRPFSDVTILLYDGGGLKGWAETTADFTGFYSTELFADGQKVHFVLGDQVVVNKPGHSREITLNLYHVSHIHPWTDRVFGTIYGIEIPAQGSQGKVDVWNAIEKKWYTQYAWIEADGQYGADFSEITDLQSGTMIRVWATAPDGSQQAAFGWDLALGVSLSNDYVWGYTTAESEVPISLYRALDGNTPVDLIGSALTLAQSNGYFITRVKDQSQNVDISPTNILVVDTGEQLKTLFIGEVGGSADVDTDILSVHGPDNAVIHVEGHHLFIGNYFWVETYLDANGTGEVDLSTFDIRPGDIFDLTCYFEEQGLTVHARTTAPGDPYLPVFLPLIAR